MAAEAQASKKRPVWMRPRSSRVVEAHRKEVERPTAEQEQASCG
jgi:hypothetical protein